MSSVEAIAVRPVDLARAGELFVIELLKGAEVIKPGHQVVFHGQTFRVVGILHFGDGHGPVLLGELLPEEARA